MFGVPTILSLTLDTSFVKDWLFINGVLLDRDYQLNEKKQKRIQGQTEKVSVLAMNGIVRLAVTTLTLSELNIDTVPWPIESSISTILESPEIVSEDSLLLQILGSKQTDLEKNQKRARQIIAHLDASRDYFITNDKAILQVANELEEDVGVKALTFFDFQKMISTIH